MLSATRILSVAAVLAVAGAASATPIVHFTVGTTVYTRSSGGSVSSAVASFQTASGASIANGPGIVGLAQRTYSGGSTIYATGNDGWLYTATGVGGANPVFKQVVQLTTSAPLTISFDFFGADNEYLIGTRGNQIFRLDLNTNVQNNEGSIGAPLAQTPGTARIGNDFYGFDNDGDVAKLGSDDGLGNFTPGTVSIGNLGQGAPVIAGGGSLAGGLGQFYATLGYGSLNGINGADDLVKFGYIDLSTGQFVQIGSNIALTGNGLTQAMGMMVIIPLPTSVGMAAAALAGAGLLTRRRFH